MPDRENVVGHLNDCMEASRRDNTWVFVRKDIVEDALALLKEQQEEIENLKQTAQSMMEGICLLKEQDAVEPEFVRNEWRCGACGHVVLTYCFDINEGEMGKVMANYCPHCGKAVKWK